MWCNMSPWIRDISHQLPPLVRFRPIYTPPTYVLSVYVWGWVGLALWERSSSTDIKIPAKNNDDDTQVFLSTFYSVRPACLTSP